MAHVLTQLLTPGELPSAAFQELVNQKYLLSHFRQLHFQQIVGDRSWALSLTPSNADYGRLRFGVDTTNIEFESSYKIQLIASVCFLEQSWQWGWANDLLPPELVQGVVETRDKYPNIPEFQAAKVPLMGISESDQKAFAFQLASAFSVCQEGAKAFFTAPNGMNGYLFVAIVDDDFPPPKLLDSMTMIREIMSVIDEADYLTNVPLAVESFLIAMGAIKLLDNSNNQQHVITYAFPTLAVGNIYVTLDESGCLQKMATTK